MIVAAIAASLALFACGGDREASGVTPAAEPAETATGAGGPKTAKGPVPPAPAPGQPAAAPNENPEASSFPIPDETAASTFGSEEPEEEAEPRKTVSAEPLPGGGHVFTNKDLQRYRPLKSAFGMEDEADGTLRQPPSAGNGDRGAADPEDPNKPEDDKSLSPQEAQAQIDATQAEIAKAEEDLKYLRSRGPSLLNPFLPRVQLSEDDTANEKGMDNVQRLEHVNARISETEARINELRQKLDSLGKTPPPDQNQ